MFLTPLICCRHQQYVYFPESEGGIVFHAENITATNFKLDYQISAMDLGPIDKSILSLQSQHRSTLVWDDQDPRVLHIRRRDASFFRTRDIDQRIVPYLQSAGFYGVARVGFISLDWHLITAFVERWREETHTFHLPVGEATITLQDVSLQLGLPVNGLPISCVANPPNFSELCQELLGYTPSDQEKRGNRFNMSRLSEQYPALSDEATDVEIQKYTRAYILQLISGSLFSDKSNNLVHVMYLQFLANFEEAGKYSWGSACLAWLYREICRATVGDAKEISGCLILLQLWIWDRFPYLAPQRLGFPRADHAGPHAPLMAAPPLGYRWRDSFITVHTPTHELAQIRELVDRMTPDQIKERRHFKLKIKERRHFKLKIKERRHFKLKYYMDLLSVSVLYALSRPLRSLYQFSPSSCSLLLVLPALLFICYLLT